MMIRYRVETSGGIGMTMRRNKDGRWVKYKDVQQLQVDLDAANKAWEGISSESDSLHEMYDKEHEKNNRLKVENARLEAIEDRAEKMKGAIEQWCDEAVELPHTPEFMFAVAQMENIMGIGPHEVTKKFAQCIKDLKSYRERGEG